VVVERRSPAPLVPSSILRVPRAGGRRPGRGHAAGRAGALLFLGTLHLQQVLGYTALRTGLAYLALSLPVVAASPAAACLVTRLGRRSVAVAGIFNTAQQVGNALALAALRLRAGVEGGPGPPLQRSTRGPGPPPSGRAPVDGPNRPPACR
jgi:hypothetical protein